MTRKYTDADWTEKKVKREKILREQKLEAERDYTETRKIKRDLDQMFIFYRLTEEDEARMEDMRASQILLLAGKKSI